MTVRRQHRGSSVHGAAPHCRKHSPQCTPARHRYILFDETVFMLLFLLIVLVGKVVAQQLEPYSVLGVRSGAGEAEIRRAYRAAALVNHPDKVSPRVWMRDNCRQPLPLPPPLVPAVSFILVPCLCLQNSSVEAQQQFLLVQQAYDALRSVGSGSSSSRDGNPFDRQEHERRTAWQRFWQQPRPPPHIPSETEELDSTSFYRRVLLSERSSGTAASGSGSTRDNIGGPAGQAWLVQVYSPACPYCRVLSTRWEAAASELHKLVQLGRINLASQAMLVGVVVGRTTLVALLLHVRVYPCLLWRSSIFGGVSRRSRQQHLPHLMRIAQPLCAGPHACPPVCPALWPAFLPCVLACLPACLARVLVCLPVYEALPPIFLLTGALPGFPPAAVFGARSGPRTACCGRLPCGLLHNGLRSAF